jgi:hypothetical protein
LPVRFSDGTPTIPQATIVNCGKIEAGVKVRDAIKLVELDG